MYTHPLKEPLRIVLAALNLEEGPEAVPLGAASVASALKAAFPGAVFSLVEGFVAGGVGALVKKIKKEDPGIVGFSLYSWNRALMIGAAGSIGSENPGLFLFCGGPEAAARPGGLHRAQGGPFDAVIPGEGEAAAIRLLREHVFEKRSPPEGRAGPDIPGKPLSAELAGPGVAVADPAGSGVPAVEPESGGRGAPGPPLSELPSPWLDGTLSVKGRQGVLWELARGCPYACAYCYESKGYDRSGPEKGVRYFSEERVREELRLFVKERVPYVFALDPTFNIDNPRALRILDMISRETHKGPKLPENHRARGKSCRPAPAPDTHWHFEVRAELLTREQARRFAALGASLQIGLQTADPRVSALAGRSLDRGLFASRIQMLNREGVSFGLDLIYGLPGDTLAGYRKSLDFALSLYPNNLDMFRLSVLPGTRFAEQAEELRLTADPEAPYEVRAAGDFSGADMDRAERLSGAADLFYNRGRAVAWFNQILYPLGLKPAAFLDGFADYLDEAGVPDWDKKGPPQAVLRDGSLVIEKLQLAYLGLRYKRGKKEALLPAVRDLVRYHGDWNRARAGETGDGGRAPP